MTDVQAFYLFLAIFAGLYGVSVFVAERVLVVLSAVAAIVTAVLALVLAF